MIRKELLERIVDMSVIASDDPTRYTIGGVKIECTELGKGSRVKLVATNGHMLMERTFEFPTPACPLGKFFLFIDEARAVKLVLKESGKFDELLPADIDSNGHLLVGQFTKARISKLEHQYPDYKAIIPNLREKVAITLNAEYLAMIGKVLVDGNKRSAPHIRIVFDPAKPTSALLIEKEGTEGMTAVIMPVKDKGTSNYNSDFLEARPLREVEECVS